jgi:hypothetical protein
MMSHQMTHMLPRITTLRVSKEIITLSFVWLRIQTVQICTLFKCTPISPMSEYGIMNISHRYSTKKLVM